MPQPRPTEPDTADPDREGAQVARAAAELGIAVPSGFWLLGVGDDGRHTAAMNGQAADYRYGCAILARLDGKPVEECLAEMDDRADGGPDPRRTPPTKLTGTDAIADSVELERHPAWPRIYNGPGDWTSVLESAAGIAAIAQAAKSVLNLQTRRAFAKYVVDQAARQGVPIDPAAVIRAFEGSPLEPGEAMCRTDTHTATSDADEPTGRE
jgi:hypothetical protein